MGPRAAGWTLALLAGGVWGVAFFSWGLPLPIPARVAATLLLVLAMSVASPAGRLGAGAFTLGMAISSAIVVIRTGELLEWWSTVPVLSPSPSATDNDGTDSDGVDTTGNLTDNDGTDSAGVDPTGDAAGAQADLNRQ